MQGIALIAHLDQACDAALVVACACLHLGFAQHARDRCTRDAVINHVDHATHGAATIEQGGWAAQNLDAVGGQHVQRHRMVITERSGVQAGGAVVQHTDAVTIEPANDGTARVGTKVSAGHAGQAVQGFTQSALPAFEQIGAAQGAHRHGGAVAPQRVAGDDDFTGHTRCGALRPSI